MNKNQNGQIHRELEISGYQWACLTRPCIYIWWRNRDCFYVGKSENGIIRPLNENHHVINKAAQVIHSDHFEIIFPELAADAPLEQWELYYIDKFKPLFNKQLKNYESSFTGSSVSKSNVQKTIPTKEELANILFTSVQNGSILDDTSDCKNYTTEKLKQIVISCKTARKTLKELQGLKERKIPIHQPEVASSVNKELKNYLNNIDFSKV